jgi:hypothetical protein
MSDLAFILYISGVIVTLMYKIISPPGYHGTLGQRIQAEINCDRGKRNLNATVKQYTAKGIVKPKVNECFKSELFDKIRLAIELNFLFL